MEDSAVVVVQRDCSDAGLDSIHSLEVVDNRFVPGPLGTDDAVLPLKTFDHPWDSA